MIPQQCITEWKLSHAWQHDEQVEQDLLLSQAICEISNNQLLGNELVFRGGTAFHKLFLTKPYRYSEDLDYVRKSAGGIGPITKELTELGRDLGFRVNTKMGMYPKVIWKFEYNSGIPGKIKIEINTYERSPVFPLQQKPYAVNSSYYQAEASVQTFQIEELIASKLRALYQRSKGRDLFDIWLALTELELEPLRILEAFPAYLPEKVTAEKMITNLEDKLSNKGFCSDMDNLMRNNGLNYDPKVAGRLVIDELLSKLEGM